MNSILPNLGLRVDTLALAMVLDAEEQVTTNSNTVMNKSSPPVNKEEEPSSSTKTVSAMGDDDANKSRIKHLKYVVGNDAIRTSASSAS